MLIWSRRIRVPDEGLCVLVLMLVKLSTDRGSDLAVKRAVMECLEEALRDTSGEMVSNRATVV